MCAYDSLFIGVLIIIGSGIFGTGLGLLAAYLTNDISPPRH